MKQLKKNRKFINYDVIITKDNHYKITVNEDIVYITVPVEFNEIKIEEILLKKFDSLYHTIFMNKHYVVHYKGIKYKLETIKSKKDKVYIIDNKLIIESTKGTQQHFSSLYIKFLKETVEEEITKLYYDLEKSFYEIKIPKIIVKKIARYLGYNHIDYIEISPKIAKYDPIYIKVLLYHEVCHSLIRGHADNFWDLLETKLPGGVELNKKMNETVYYDALYR